MRKWILVLSGAMMMLLNSCGQFIYKSVSVHTPLLTKRNDFNAQLNIGGSGGEAYAAYSPVKYAGLSAGYAGYTYSDSANRKKYRFNDFEFTAFPYYAKEKLRLEMPLGIGFTQKNSLDHSFTNFSPYQRLFVQPTVGVAWDAFEMAFFCRVTNVQYSNHSLGIDKRYEPGIMLRGASKNIKAMFQVRMDYGTNTSKAPGSTVPLDLQAEYLPIHFSFGVSINFNAAELNKKQ